MITIEISTALAILAVLVIPALVAWISLLMRVTRLESRQDAKDNHIAELQKSFNEFTAEIRAVIYTKSK